MVPGHYLPPYTADERASTGGVDAHQTSAGTGATSAASGDEVTYADFLGDQVDDDADR
ncbi:hypothetical protein [Curtobacterium sp. MCSS17_008]|uniref:hypothetical protein n=1 Tax=Curtobacterium sp. MCSS17_008 TaxID=2175647 RepID=UPI0015E8D69E|nr:hypothetical protein [Curtobacterium sp. MCSS17_008]